MLSKNWVFEEAEKLCRRFDARPPDGAVVFETGYGPSGLPHIGTFGEVFRTTMVRRAFERLSGHPTRLIAFSDDMDGLRKVPDNIPQAEMVAEHLGKPLTSIPDPFGTHESFGAHMNARLQGFLDRFGFEYEFCSATECYKSGVFDDALLRVLERYDDIMSLILPTLGQERQQTYSPFLPICERTGQVLQAKVIARGDGVITYERDGAQLEVPVTGGACKLQWKADWGMRWAALGVDYEMYGKDLIPSAKLSERICKLIGHTPPEQYFYELFLDENGAKISKSKGNGLSLEEWLRYGTQESLSLFMFTTPRKAKRLYFDVIPKNVDEFFTYASKAATQEGRDLYANPAWHICDGHVDGGVPPVSFNLLLNLASACNPEDESVLWGFVSRYAHGATAQSHPKLAELIKLAISYYEDFVRANKHFRAPTEGEAAALRDLAVEIGRVSEGAAAEDLQTLVFTVGKNHGYEKLGDWFKTLYQLLFGQDTGPRMGSFIELFGVEETISLINERLLQPSL